MFIVPTDMISKCCCFCILHFYYLCFCIFTSGTYTSQFTVTRTTRINGRGIEMALVIYNTFRLFFYYLYYCILTFNMILICLLCHLLHTHQFTVTQSARIVMALIIPITFNSYNFILHYCYLSFCILNSHVIHKNVYCIM